MKQNRTVRQADVREYVNQMAAAIFEPRYKALCEEQERLVLSIADSLVDRHMKRRIEALPKELFSWQTCFSMHRPHYNCSEWVTLYLDKNQKPVTLPILQQRPWEFTFNDLDTHAKRKDAPEKFKAIMKGLNQVNDKFDQLRDEGKLFVSKALALLLPVRSETGLRRVWPDIADDFFATYGAPQSTALVVQCTELNAVIGNVRLAQEEAHKEAA